MLDMQGVTSSLHSPCINVSLFHIYFILKKKESRHLRQLFTLLQTHTHTISDTWPPPPPARHLCISHIRQNRPPATRKRYLGARNKPRQNKQ